MIDKKKVSKVSHKVVVLVSTSGLNPMEELMALEDAICGCILGVDAMYRLEKKNKEEFSESLADVLKQVLG